MTDTVTHPASVEPAALYERDAVATEQRTYTHEDPDHCEADAAGRAIVGLTDDDGRLLVVVEPDGAHVVLPNEVVAPGDDWAAAARERVVGMADIDVTLDGVALVRRVEHVLGDETEPRSTTHHVLFEASPAGGDVGGLCDTNDWELRWWTGVPPAFSADDSPAVDDIRWFLE